MNMLTDMGALGYQKDVFTHLNLFTPTNGYEKI